MNQTNIKKALGEKRARTGCFTPCGLIYASGLRINRALDAPLGAIPVGMLHGVSTSVAQSTNETQQILRPKLLRVQMNRALGALFKAPLQLTHTARIIPCQWPTSE